MKPTRIRELARRYAAGELSLDEYRAQRRKLIDGVTAGLLALEYGEPNSSHNTQSYFLWASGIVVLLATIGIGTSLWVQHVHHRTDMTNVQAGTQADSGSALVRTFIDTNDWSDASLKQFMQRWKALPPREQKAAYQSYLYPRLLSQLREQIASQQAVVDLTAGDHHASDPASVHLANLQQLSSVLQPEP
jgi:Short C-terminal domain